MRASNSRPKPMRAVLLGLAAAGAMGTTGCQVDIGGQVHPSPYYLSDDVQYFPPGPEFKLAREAAAMQEQAPQQQWQP